MIDVPSVHRISYIYHIFIKYKVIWCLCNSDIWIYSWNHPWGFQHTYYVIFHPPSQKEPITQKDGLFRELFLHRALGCHIPKHTHFCNAAAWTASRLQTKPCKLSLSHKHQATSRRDINLGHKQTWKWHAKLNTVLRARSKMRRHREPEREIELSVLRLLPRCRERLHVF